MFSVFGVVKLQGKQDFGLFVNKTKIIDGKTHFFTSILITWYLKMEFHTQYKLLSILMFTYQRIINDNTG